jgi:hypothetical protein
MHSCVIALFAVDLAAAPALRETVDRNIGALLGSFQGIDAGLEELRR